MKRLPFYQVPKDCYLFPVASAEQSLEEPVRQWCAYELIRVYGYPITNLAFEHPVKVGSKTYKIDIVVSKEGRPWIVVECKEPKFSPHEKALEQAESYASASSIQAEFLLYTNGSKWLVRRRLKDFWIAIDDLPSASAMVLERNLVDILDGVAGLKPILYKLDEPLSGLDAQCLLDHLQRFFNSYNPLLAPVDRELIDATDHVLRAVADKSHHVNYRAQKLGHAHRQWEEYRSVKSFGSKMNPLDSEGTFRPLIGKFLSDLEDLLTSVARPLTVDSLVLRLNIALLAYGLENENTKPIFVSFSPAIHQSLRDLLNTLLAVSFHAHLPDPIDGDANSRIKGFCANGWQEIRESFQRQGSLWALIRP